MGRFFNFIVRKVLLPKILDTQAGLKGFNRNAVQTIFKRLTLIGFSFDVEVLYLAQKFGLTIKQVPICFKYFFEESTVAFFKDTVKMLRDIFSIKIKDWKGHYK